MGWSVWKVQDHGVPTIGDWVREPYEPNQGRITTVKHRGCEHATTCHKQRL